MDIFHAWHTMLNMPKHDEAWHRKDMADELAEYKEAHGLIDTWSELSDVVYTYTRAKWSNHTNIIFPFSKLSFYIGALYMFPKYTLRWKFFQKLGYQFDKNLNIREVRNPKKIEKLKTIAEAYDLDTEEFVSAAKRLMRYWFFLK
ncbi:MAG: hypothetical protein ACJKTH_03245 [Patescibacteria group bacterium UBA2163]